MSYSKADVAHAKRQKERAAVNPSGHYVIQNCARYFWGPNKSGYYDLLRAGLYTKEEAENAARNRPTEDRAMPLEEAIALTYLPGDRLNLTVLTALVRAATAAVKPSVTP